MGMLGFAVSGRIGVAAEKVKAGGKRRLNAGKVVGSCTFDTH